MLASLAQAVIAGDEGEPGETVAEPPLQELFQTETVYAQEKGETQVTLAGVWHHARGGDLVQLPVRVEFGLTDAWQIGAAWDAFVYNKSKSEGVASGIGDVELETKWSFMNIAGSAWHAAVGLGLTLPAGRAEKELGEGRVAWEPFAVVARDLPSLGNLQLFAQVGLGLVQSTKSEEDGAGAHELMAGGGFLLPFERVVLSGELNWSSNRWNHGGTDSDLYFTPGLTWRLPRRWEIGVGAPIGLTRDSDRVRAIVQVTTEF